MITDQIKELKELLRISQNQNKEFKSEIEEKDSEIQDLKEHLLVANTNLATRESLIEEYEMQIIDFNYPFNAAQRSMSQMSGLRIEKVVTYSKEISRILREQLSLQIPKQRLELNVNESALRDLNS